MKFDKGLLQMIVEKLAYYKTGLQILKQKLILDCVYVINSWLKFYNSCYLVY